MSDPIEQFRAAIAAAGLTPPDDIYCDGKLHRFSTSGKPRDDSGWYVLHLDGIPAGAFGCWRTGVKKHWCSKSPENMNPVERNAHHERVAAMRQQRESAEAERHQQVAITAASRWHAATPAKENQYLTVKGVNAYDVRVEADGFLIVPMRDVDGKLWNIERINPADGKEKKGLRGGRRTGCFHSIGEPGEVLILCEGYATGASIHEATGQAVAVAFNAGNLLEVAQALHGKYPTLRLIVSADDDWKTNGNPGITKATEAARAVGGYLAVPTFPADRPGKATDFNDLHALAGLDAVKAGIDAAVAVEAGEVFPALDNVNVAREGQRQPEVLLLNGEDLTPEPVRWLWPDWLALGKLHILAGAPGQGKTTIALACAATVSNGGRWPDGGRCDPGNILVWSGEDDPADTLLPRLIAAGADKKRCYFVTGTRINGEMQPFDPARDMAGLEVQAHRIGGLKLLIVDPVVSAVTGDSHKNTEVRRALQPLVDLASRLDAAVLGISHFSKGGAGGDPAARVVGSIAFTAVARIVLVAAKVKGDDGEDRRILARGKSNIGPDDGGFEYHIEQSEPIPGISASSVTWGRSVTGTARELLAESDSDNMSAGEKSAKAEAEEFLIQLLMDGPCPTQFVKTEARAAGISWATVRRASDALGIRKRKVQDSWYWDRPHLLTQLAQDAQRSNVGQVEQVEDHDDLRDF